jgi:catechol 2,3-dioxygenase-like lactoylglutathione lyase family enzyme
VTGITQVGIVVRDAAATARRYWEDLGVGPWRFYTIDPRNTPGMTLRGRPVEHAFRAALARVGAIELELIQPLDGDSLYAEFLELHGEGVQHLAFGTEDLARTLEVLGDRGYREVQGGRTFGTGRYVYLDTDERLGTLTELGERAGELPPPDEIYP